MVTRIVNAVAQFVDREDGPTAVEYAVALALIIVVCISAIQALGANANQTFTNVSGTLNEGGSQQQAQEPPASHPGPTPPRETH